MGTVAAAACSALLLRKQFATTLLPKLCCLPSSEHRLLVGRSLSQGNANCCQGWCPGSWSVPSTLSPAWCPKWLHCLYCSYRYSPRDHTVSDKAHNHLCTPRQQQLTADLPSAVFSRIVLHDTESHLSTRLSCVLNTLARWNQLCRKVPEIPVRAGQGPDGRC